MSSSINKKNKLVRKLIEFCTETIKGHESGFYKTVTNTSMLPLTRDDLKTDKMYNIITLSAINYLNICYKSLILKNDPYVINKFKEMTDIFTHSEVCLLNIICMLLMKVHTGLDRKNLDIASYEKYMKSLTVEIDLLTSPQYNMLLQNVNHVCTGEDITTCNPNEPMFHAKQYE